MRATASGARVADKKARNVVSALDGICCLQHKGDGGGGDVR
ncbi:MAG TPA: hypothetical protein PKK00_06220 [Bacteroidales bacterium]|nr:hypothetical protein [Bacteroidales bacterium]HPS16885.1 hypothetical protein [Bacteroidales bacterium]